MKQIIFDLWTNKRMVLSLAKNDFKQRFAGSYFGIMWAFVNPVVTIMLYWFVFTIGFRNPQSNGSYPFELWLIAGLIPWFLFSEALTSGTNALLEYSYLVKKVVFKIDILPIVKIMSASVVHFFFLIMMVIVYWFMGYPPSLYQLQIIYYLICMWMLLIALVYTTSAIVLFFRDLGQIITIFMQVFMWMTPIMWDESALGGGKITLMYKLNPMYYVVRGYRESFLTYNWVTNHLWSTVYFWGVVIVCMIIGTTIFNRLRPHFADVL